MGKDMPADWTLADLLGDMAVMPLCEGIVERGQPDEVMTRHACQMLVWQLRVSELCRPRFDQAAEKVRPVIEEHGVYEFAGYPFDVVEAVCGDSLRYRHALANFRAVARLLPDWAAVVERCHDTMFGALAGFCRTFANPNAIIETITMAEEVRQVMGEPDVLRALLKHSQPMPVTVNLLSALWVTAGPFSGELGPIDKALVAVA